MKNTISSGPMTKKGEINKIFKLLIIFISLMSCTKIFSQINSTELPININAESTGYIGDQSTLTFEKINISQGDISIYADYGESSKLDFENSIWKFEGNIEIKIENGSINSDYAYIEFKKHRIKNVKIRGVPATLSMTREGKKTQTIAKANRIDYDFEKSLVDFSGNVSIEEGGNQISSDYLVYNLDNQSIQAQSDNKGDPKVKITYTPNISRNE